MKKILKTLIIVITFIILNNIFSLQEVVIPIPTGKIIFYSYLANTLKVLFAVIVFCISFFISKYVDVIFRGKHAPKNKAVNRNMNKRNIERAQKINIIDENIEEGILEKYSKIYSNNDSDIEKNNLNIVKEIKKIDKYFNDVLFLVKAHEFSIELIKTRIVRETSAEYVYESFKKNIITVNSPYFYSFAKNENFYIIKLRVEEFKEKRLMFTHELTFVKSLKDNITSRKCPRCGASLKENSYGVCEYCLKYSDKQEKKKIKSNVTNFSYDVPVIKFKKILPDNCINCGAPLRKALGGFCEYCKSDNNPGDNLWVLIDFTRLDEKDDME